MPTALSDPSSTLYAILVIVVAVLGFVAMRNRRRGEIIRLAIGLTALLALFAIDRLVESPREESTRKMLEIAAATRAKNLSAAFAHLSDSFSYNGMNKAQLSERAQALQGQTVLDWNGIDVVGFNRADVEPVDAGKIKIGFETYPTGYGLPEYRRYCWATFQKDPDGQYRMLTFDLYKKKPAFGEGPDVPVQFAR